MLFVVAATAVLATGCGDERPDTATGAAPAKAGSGPSQSSARPPAKREPPKPALEALPNDGGGEPVDGPATSIAECDQYLAKLEACLQKVGPQKQQEAMRAAFRAQRDSWRQSAKAAKGNPEVASQLAKNCKEALAAARTTMQRRGCDW